MFGGVFDMHPFTLLVCVLMTLTVKQVVNAIGKKQLETFLWLVYCKIAPKFGHTKLNTIANKKQQAFEINKSRKAISAQDEYAKWTKLNRQFDKLTDEINKLNDQVTGEKAQVSKLLGLVITALTTIPIWFFRVWFRKSVLFYIPAGLFPYPIERLLALPFVPVGGIGLTVWMFASNSVISSIIFLIKFPFETPVEKPIKSEKVENINQVNDDKEKNKAT